MTDVMKLWVLGRLGEVGYDEYGGFVARATTEQEARTYASEQAGDEGAETWLDPVLSSCVILPVRGEAGIVMDSYHAG